MASPDIIPLREFTPYKLAVLSNLVSGRIAEAYLHYHISIPQWRVMAVLAEHPEFTATDIAEYTAMDKATISRAVRGLSDMGYITRIASQHDGRSSHLQITAKGKRIYREIVPKARTLEAKLLSALSQKEATMLNSIMQKLHHQCERL